MDYKHKYLKYKIKYLNAKQKKIIGGSNATDEKDFYDSDFIPIMANYSLGEPALPLESKESEDNFSNEESDDEPDKKPDKKTDNKSDEKPKKKPYLRKKRRDQQHKARSETKKKKK